MEYGHLSHDQRLLYNRTITAGGAHRRRVELHTMTLDGRAHRSLTTKLLSGSQITTDVDQTPMQVATLQFIDRTRSMVFEPEAAGDAPIHRQYQIRINDRRYIPTLGWVDCWVFCGPIWDFSRTGAQVSITAHSVDRLALGDVRRAHMWRRKTRKTDIIKGLLTAAGATRLRVPDLRATTPVHVHIGVTHPKKKGVKPHKTRRITGFQTTRQTTYWDKATGLADSMNRLLFPTTDGTFELRSHPERPIFHFDRALVGDVQLQRPGNDGPNTWLVTGAKPKGAKRRVSSGLVGFPVAHPLSAFALAWHGKPYQILETSQNPHCKTRAECRRIAFRKRDRAARMLAEVDFDAVPIPWLRPWDLVTAQAGWGVPRVHIHQMTYPLSYDSTPMTIGAAKLARPRIGVHSRGVA